MEERQRRILNHLVFGADDGLLMPVIGEVAEQLVQPVERLPQENQGRERRPRNEKFVEVTIPRYSDDLFKEHFRMSRGTCQVLFNMLGNHMHHNNNRLITLEKKVLFTLWTLAKPESFLAAGDRFGLARSTAHGIFKNIIIILSDMMHQFVKFPGRAEFDAIGHVFNIRSRGIPGVVGVIDGCHIPIKQPQNNAHDFYNRKGFHSVILQGICDHRGKFINCFIGMPGRMHDARVFRSSPIYQQLTDPQNPILPDNFHLIGDAAYPLSMYLLCPYRDNGHLDQIAERFNTKLSIIRSIIERVFGVLKSKFRRLKYLDTGDAQFTIKIIAAACTLYNFLIDQGDINMHEDLIDIEELDNADNDFIDGNAPPIEAAQKRSNIAEHL